MKFNFKPKPGSGIARMLPHASAKCIALVNALVTYDPDQRLSARQALRHPYFKDLRALEKRARTGVPHAYTRRGGKTKKSSTGAKGSVAEKEKRRSKYGADAGVKVTKVGVPKLPPIMYKTKTKATSQVCCVVGRPPRGV